MKTIHVMRLAIRTIIITAILMAGPLPLARADAINEVEPNNTFATAQLLSSIGYENPVNASINPIGDIDWFKFQAYNGRTYVVELYNAASGLAGSGNPGECRGYYGDEGVGIQIYDQAENEVVSACDAYGAGNVHNYVSFTAGLDGMYYVKIIANSNTVAGSYNMRILPKHDEPGASWDGTTYEPNNSRWNAYAISLGWENALSSTIEQRDIA
jgi:hypothetical protein